jgi:hypothetical protein
VYDSLKDIKTFLLSKTTLSLVKILSNIQLLHISVASSSCFGNEKLKLVLVWAKIKKVNREKLFLLGNRKFSRVHEWVRNPNKDDLRNVIDVIFLIGSQIKKRSYSFTKNFFSNQVSDWLIKFTINRKKMVYYNHVRSAQ